MQKKIGMNLKIRFLITQNLPTTINTDFSFPLLPEYFQNNSEKHLINIPKHQFLFHKLWSLQSDVISIDE